MEQQKNQIDQNFAKVEINPFTTQEMLIQQMEQFLNQEEIQLAIFKRSDCNIILENILQKLKKLNNLNIFKITLQNFREIDFDHLFSHTSNIRSIRELDITLFKDIQQFKPISHNAGHYLCQLNDLQILNLQMNLKRFQYSEQTFNFYEVYQKCNKLKKLDFTIKSSNYNTFIFESLLDGIRLILNLEKLNIRVYGKLCYNSLFNKLYNELKDLKNIKSLELSFIWSYGAKFQEFKNLFQQLSKISSLESIKISIALNIQEVQQDDQYDDLKKIMSEFQSLKKLNFNLCYCKNINLIKMLESIASLPNVEETTIDFYVNETSSFQNNLSNLVKALCSVQSLIALNIYFSSIIEINFEQYLNLISELKNLQKLKKLTLYSQMNRNQKTIPHLNFDDLIETAIHF
ncbi:hypothetical protein TTHERM_00002720 (macronuclear) [Tetrahymena thermophila SB210]|uniref:Kinase domain protein n=1 Tax=Tetrahymena thermophila (strain SB210) TaxID=312017 RepID=Q22SG4_TETTS|nr:hypothetical protein TTHERM_00002720 [Tetrahymena thermophila SB210]EAR87808.2 hypothetical protein TTHERM_00002720 [Tetrahymena thermophila SB210]|eukprot:XP_001008053.2 hypothetical protein TTHERM_00002720 [Tetrahymena thermophila SB210]